MARAKRATEELARIRKFEKQQATDRQAYALKLQEKQDRKHKWAMRELLLEEFKIKLEKEKLKL